MRDVQQPVRVRNVREQLRYVPLHMQRGIQIGRVRRELHRHRRMRKSAVMSIRKVHQFGRVVQVSVPPELRIGGGGKRLHWYLSRMSTAFRVSVSYF